MEKVMERVKEYPLPGLRVYDLVKFPDERGFFSEIMREDWNDPKIIDPNSGKLFDWNKPPHK